MAIRKIKNIKLDLLVMMQKIELIKGVDLNDNSF